MSRMPCRIGFTCGSFDLLHAGHVLMLEEAKKQCDHLIVAVQTDPTIDRPHKNQPVQTIEERTTVLRGIKYVDEIRTYSTEVDLYDMLFLIGPDIRILGADWEGKIFTGVRGIPCFVAVDNGVEKSRAVGMQSLQQLKDLTI